MHCKEFAKIEIRGMVASSVCALLRTFAPPNARIMDKPSKSVIANKNFDVREYIVVPASHSIIIEPKLAVQCPQKSVEVRVTIVSAPKVFINPEMPSKEFAAQFWCVRVSHDREKANCEFVDKTLKMRQPTLLKQNTNPIIDIVIPCITNFKKVKTDEEFVLFRPAPLNVEKKRRSPVILLESKAKKAKVES